MKNSKEENKLKEEQSSRTKSTWDNRRN